MRVHLSLQQSDTNVRDGMACFKEHVSLKYAILVEPVTRSKHNNRKRSYDGSNAITMARIDGRVKPPNAGNLMDASFFLFLFIQNFTTAQQEHIELPRSCQTHFLAQVTGFEKI
jgi:hypothetical protein